METRRLPLPPLDLANRVGSLGDEEQLALYETIGAALRTAIDTSLPEDWDWRGKRALDFGCGAGRVLRHYADEAADAEFWGCDIDDSSIAWMREHLSPPFHPFVVEEAPGLPQSDDFFDVVWATSVFTHLSDNWSGWLLELHRALRPGGYLISTFLGVNMSEILLGEEWDEDRIGMNVVGAARPWSEGGPSVFHSEWWLRSHWGRAFEVDQFLPNAGSPGTHGIIVLRKKPVSLTIADLERLEADEPRELAALVHNLRQLHAEDGRVRHLLNESRQREAASEQRIAALEQRVAELQQADPPVGPGSGLVPELRARLEDGARTLRSRIAQRR